jgi:outer membrane protein
MRITFKHRLAASIGALILASAALAPATLAADVTDIGFVDQAALSNLPAFNNANRQLGKIKAALDAQFSARVRGVKATGDQAKIAQEFQNKFTAKQREILGPLFQRAQISIASVASSKNLSVVVDKRIVIFGGQDVTRNVIDLFSGVGDPVPPVSTPPPSSVGYVDQAQINQVAKIKNANDTFIKFQNEQTNAAQAKMRSAKTDQDRQQIFKDLQKTLLDKRKQTIDPVVEQMRKVIEDVARKKGLLLVIDRSNLLYGGMDITADVSNALK